MQEELNKLLQETEAQHEKFVVLYAQINEQVIKLKSEKEKVIHMLTSSKGQIEAYKKTLEIVNKGE